jgi:hypothetical protein
MFLQHPLVPWVARVTGETVIPSFTWLMRYQAGAILGRHRDRPQCRWNVSLCVDSENESRDTVDWPLFFKVDGAVRAAYLETGEGVLYSGTETTHWRDQLGKDEAVSFIFLHYVNDGFRGRLR